MTLSAERKRRVDAKLRLAGLVRVYVPALPGRERRFMLMPPGDVPPAARRIPGSDDYELVWRAQ